MQHLGLVSILFVWAGLLFLIHKWKGNVSMTFSQHAAKHKSSQIYYLILFLVELPLFTLFMLQWFVPTYNLPFVFVFFLIVATLGQLIAAIVPETTGSKVHIHRYAAFVMSDCMVILNVLIGLSPNLSILVRVIGATAALIQLAIIIYLFKDRAYHAKILPIQATHVAVFHITILAATYLS